MNGTLAAETLYGRLIDGLNAIRIDAFDGHVVASILALAFGEAQAEDKPAIVMVGLDGAVLSALLRETFPRSVIAVPGAAGIPLERSEEETCLLDLLIRGGTTGAAFEAVLAAMIARRSLRPHHLWQDLGLRNRRELSLLMERHFAPLARLNRRDMKWKKFFYRMICRDADYTLCTAPSCGECNDFDRCFGEETGESLLAQVRRDAYVSA
jgi:nitrogen fixation protein NifQ